MTRKRKKQVQVSIMFACTVILLLQRPVMSKSCDTPMDSGCGFPYFNHLDSHRAQVCDAMVGDIAVLANKSNVESDQTKLVTGLLLNFSNLPIPSELNFQSLRKFKKSGGDWFPSRHSCHLNATSEAQSGYHFVPCDTNLNNVTFLIGHHFGQGIHDENEAQRGRESGVRMRTEHEIRGKVKMERARDRRARRRSKQLDREGKLFMDTSQSLAFICIEVLCISTVIIWVIIGRLRNTHNLPEQQVNVIVESPVVQGSLRNFYIYGALSSSMVLLPAFIYIMCKKYIR